jgi:hypothetical protein
MSSIHAGTTLVDDPNNYLRDGRKTYIPLGNYSLEYNA